MLKAAQAALTVAGAMAASPETHGKPIDAREAAEFGRIVDLLRAVGSRELKADIAKALAALGKFDGTPLDGLFKVSTARPRKDAEGVRRGIAKKRAMEKQPARSGGARPGRKARGGKRNIERRLQAPR